MQTPRTEAEWKRLEGQGLTIQHKWHAEILEEELNEARQHLKRIEDFLKLSLDQAQKRYHQAQATGDGISIASTRATYLAFRDAVRELPTESKQTATEPKQTDKKREHITTINDRMVTLEDIPASAGMGVRRGNRKVVMNVWGNLNGYEGRRRVYEIGLGTIEAMDWLNGDR